MSAHEVRFTVPCAIWVQAPPALVNSAAFEPRCGCFSFGSQPFQSIAATSLAVTPLA